MARKASTGSLKAAFTDHLQETQQQVARLEQIGESLGISLIGKVCKAMQRLIEEGKEVIQEDGDGLVLDAALIAAAQRVEHYEISAYGSVCALAERLGHADAVTMLQETLDEESAADEKLNTISLEEILPEGPCDESDEPDELDESDEPDESDDSDEEDDEEEGEEPEDSRQEGVPVPAQKKRPLAKTK